MSRNNGIPLVSSSIGLEGIPGIQNLIKPTDTPEAFAAALVGLYRDDARLAAMSEALVSYAADHLDVSAARQLMREIIEG